jgi:hypothetical protein
MLYYTLSNKICFDVKMVRLKIGKSVEVSDKKDITKKDDIQEEPMQVLQKLMTEEATLIEEKKNLASLREKLLSKIQEEIDYKKNNIQKLKSEIKDLKFSCEELTKSFKTNAKVK